MNREKFWESKKIIEQATRKEISNALNNKEYGDESISQEVIENDILQNTKNLIENNPELPEEIYVWYKNAIERRDREALEEGRFIYHFFEGGSLDETYSFGDTEKGFLLGYKKQGVFIPTHFAPKTMRGGYELIKELGEGHRTPAVMSVTPDLTDTISKISSWHVVDLSFLSQFRGEALEKEFVYNSHPDTKKLLPLLVNEFIEESNSEIYAEQDGRIYS